MTYPGKGILKGVWVDDIPQGEGVYLGGIEGSNVVRYEDGRCVAKDEKEVFKRVSVALNAKEL
jgi:hypothetical protein